VTKEQILQQTLNLTLDRLGKQTVAYEVEIANLNAQLIVLNSQLESLGKSATSALNTEENQINKKESK
jgi:hypothetical protein